MKKILLTFLVLVVVGLAAYAGWRFFQRGGSSILPVPSPQPTSPPGGASPSSSRLRALTETPVFSYWINPANDAVHYITETGEVYRLTLGGEPQPVTTQPIQGLMEVIPSPDRLRALVSFGSREEPLFAVFDAAASRWQPLPEGTRAAAFGPTGENLALLVEQRRATSLFEFSLGDLKAREIAPLNVRDVTLSWPQEDTLYFADRPSASYPGSLWSFHIKNRTMERLIRDARGLMVRWANNGTTGLSLYVNEQTIPFFEFIDGSGRVVIRAPFATLPQKCALEEAIICAVPQKPLQNLPDSYLKREAYSEDALFAWNPITGKLQELFGQDEGIIDAEMLQVANGKLYFLNRYDRRIYEFELPINEEVPTPSPTGEE